MGNCGKGNDRTGLGEGAESAGDGGAVVAPDGEVPGFAVFGGARGGGGGAGCNRGRHGGVGGAKIGYAIVETCAQGVAFTLECGIPFEELSFGDVVVYLQDFGTVVTLVLSATERARQWLEINIHPQLGKSFGSSLVCLILVVGQ